MIEPHSIKYSPSNEDGLAYVYFSYGQHEYFTLARTPEEEPVIYLERNDQSLALESNNVCYTLSGNTVVFTMGEDIQQALQVGPVLEVLVNLDDRHLPNSVGRWPLFSRWRARRRAPSIPTDSR